jgi:glycerophosphoryl diester phosphodiesterase
MRMFHSIAYIVSGLMILALSLTNSSQSVEATATEPIVIGHRGASGYRPEHTLAAYRLAIQMGADFIEPDLVATKDGVLIARHENNIAETTDVAGHPEFAGKNTTKMIDGTAVTGWFTEDFTLSEIKTLKAVERLPQLRPKNNAACAADAVALSDPNVCKVPTLQEVIDLVKHEEKSGAHTSRRNGRVGIYPETKHPSYFQSINLPLEPKLVDVLDRNGYRGRSAPVFIQSFEVANLKQLDKLTDVPIVQLIDDKSLKPYDFVLAGDPRTYANLVTPAGLAEIATYADGIGPWKNNIVPRDANNNLLPPTSLVTDAHAAGLLVHTWTFRAENNFLSNEFRQGVPPSPCVPADPACQAYLRNYGDLAGEIRLFLDLGVDGFFTDHPDKGVFARDTWLANQ